MDSTNASFYCPITGDLMSDPVVDSEGNTYERIAIESWIDGHKTSPITRNVITLQDLRPNRSLKNIIDETIASGKQIKKRLDDHVDIKASAKVSVPQLSLTVTAEKLRPEWSTGCPPGQKNCM
jgi:U-box domain